MKIDKQKAKEIIIKWGWKRLPKQGRQYFHVGCGYTEILENNLGKYYYGWISK